MSPLNWLLARGLLTATISLYRLGWDGEAIIIPIPDEGWRTINLRRRFIRPGAKPKIVGLRGHESNLYPLPVIAADPTSLVIPEGEFDALLLNQYGIPAVTSTAGTVWKPAWNRYVVGRRVAILYDAGALSYEKAEARGLALRRAGAREAWPVDLTLAGFHEGEDVTDWFCKYRWSADELRAFINESRRWYRAERRAVR